MWTLVKFMVGAAVLFWTLVFGAIAWSVFMVMLRHYVVIHGVR